MASKHSNDPRQARCPDTVDLEELLARLPEAPSATITKENNVKTDKKIALDAIMEGLHLGMATWSPERLRTPDARAFIAKRVLEVLELRGIVAVEGRRWFTLDEVDEVLPYAQEGHVADKLNLADRRFLEGRSVIFSTPQMTDEELGRWFTKAEVSEPAEDIPQGLKPWAEVMAEASAAFEQLQPTQAEEA